VVAILGTNGEIAAPRSRGQRTPGLWAGSPARRVADIDGQWFDRADTHTKRIWIPDSDSVVENA